jgi:thioredoxin-like negative regulator of GroEL
MAEIKLPSYAEKDLAAAAGYRPLTKPELAKLGLSETSRAYTSQKAGVKSLRADKVLSRRQVRQQFVLREPGPVGRPLKQEAYAKMRRAKSGGVLSSDAAKKSAKKYARDHGISVRAAQRSKEYQRKRRADQRLVARTGKDRDRSEAGNRKRLQALFDLGQFDGTEFDIEDYYQE